ncbi:MAG: bifunctional alpha,alpha-trehalose-phosphate synthase (UDP-forming)/trehalose-phosphatase [candidate division WOR-3 bacterium]|nr:bifunctional alpha,alpha-trehalose-phosphate synthase (UDP-forming)/trehalose-phosphatase [candidate division WOR-3 bacterium]
MKNESSRLLIISNRLPYNIELSGEDVYLQKSVGGLATGLSSFYRQYDSMWIGWPGMEAERFSDGMKAQIIEKLGRKKCYPLFLSSREIENYYLGFSNKTVWPAFHYFPQYTIFNKKFRNTYRKVNEKFADKIAEIARKGDTIWIHDYHLMLLPKMIRERTRNVKIGFFLHIPFPAYEMFSVLPSAEEIIEGLLGSDLIGFHTYDYVLDFLNSAARLKGIDSEMGIINLDNRLVKVDMFPIGIDYDKYASSHQLPEVRNEMDKIIKRIGRKRIILSVDRLDYTKGIYNRLLAFHNFLKHNRHLHGKLTLVLVVVPSRTNVESYAEMKRQIDEIVGKIEGEFGTLDWMPIWYLYNKLEFNTLTALYNLADIGLVTPLRDGMNLIAKEYVASKQKSTGVLILSSMAGASQELAEAISINPNDIDAIESALKEAYKMKEREKTEKLIKMQKRIKRYSIIKWAEDFIRNLNDIHTVIANKTVKKLNSDLQMKIAEDFSASRRSLILLDYDGTLIPFSKQPRKAEPDKTILNIISRLSGIDNTDVVIISGRDRHILDKWFNGVNVSLIAEHGVWIKDNDGKWHVTTEPSEEWKEHVKDIMEVYVDRTPGTFIEEKDFSLVWHYRNADAQLAEVRANSLKNVLMQFTGNQDIEVVEGSKIIEVKNRGIDKGYAALKLIEGGGWDFILAAGDDRTDEDMFSVLPEYAYSVKVGIKRTSAMYNGANHEIIRNLLDKMIKAKEE